MGCGQPRFDPRSVPGLRSRGLIIPSLLGSESAEAVMSRLERVALRQYAPFRLLAIGSSPESPIAEARWDRSALQVRWHDPGAVCFVSSGLGDHLVTPRLELFEELVAGPGANPERQDEFHRHTWADRPETSVLMSRSDARTVSITTVEIAGSEVRMEYEPVGVPQAVAR
jgi:hypothetical protein